MKIKIEKQDNGYHSPIAVSYITSKFERFFGFRDETAQFVDSGFEYFVGGIKWLNYPDMTVYGHYEELDAFLRRSSNTKGYSETSNCKKEYGWAIVCMLASLLLAAFSWACFFRIHVDKGAPFIILYIILGIFLGFLALVLLRKAFIFLIKG
ncbi:MAG: hypothetical protein WC523_06080 [Patescibacteria group bacterium]|jgi:hypothetical protein